jgi:hypothetical protein
MKLATVIYIVPRLNICEVVRSLLHTSLLKNFPSPLPTFFVIVPVVIWVRVLFSMHSFVCSILIVADAKSSIKMCFMQSVCDFIVFLKGKAIPLQAWTGP